MRLLPLAAVIVALAACGGSSAPKVGNCIDGSRKVVACGDSSAKQKLVSDQEKSDAIACIEIGDTPQTQVKVQGHDFCAEPKQAALLRAGSGPPLVLLHGITGSERMWSHVLPLLAPHHDTVAFTALGHRGGRPAKPGVRIADLVDDAERTLDDLGLDRPHLAGNSMGGWLAIELARRGRAATVCALSPAGSWDEASGGQEPSAKVLRAVARLVTRTRRVLPLAARVPAVRRFALRDNAVHGERLSPEELVTMADDLLACTAREDLLASNESIAPLDPTPCPITLAWSERDRVVPPDVNGETARRLIPQAEWQLLPGVGHVPMIDDPELVAETILKRTRKGPGRQAPPGKLDRGHAN